MKLEIAKKIIEAGIAELLKRDKHAAVAVCDQSGELVCFARTDGVRLCAIQIAMNKAYTAARDRGETMEIGNMLRESNSGYDITFYGDPRFTGFGGGIPIFDKSIHIGAIGVSGLTETEDIEIAKLALLSYL